MKNIILILLGFLFVLSGCTDTSYSEAELVNGGYMVNETDNVVYRSWDNSDVFVSFEENNDIKAVGINTLPTSYQSVQLKYVYMDSKWVANFTIGNEIKEINPNDAYAYIEVVAPEATSDLLMLVEHKNISTKDLKDGDAKVVEDLLAFNIIISNLKIIDSTYPSPYVEDEFLNAAYYTQANFDLTNNTSADINLGETYFGLCYSTPDAVACEDLEVVEPSDTNLENKVLKPGETISIQMKSPTSADASNFYVSFGIPSMEIYIDSVVVEKSN